MIQRRDLSASGKIIGKTPVYNSVVKTAAEFR